ncbi:MAG: hypothetical protein ACRDRK_18465 [Pseudonocardia sp.]
MVEISGWALIGLIRLMILGLSYRFVTTTDLASNAARGAIAVTAHFLAILAAASFTFAPGLTDVERAYVHQCGSRRQLHDRRTGTQSRIPCGSPHRDGDLGRSPRARRCRDHRLGTRNRTRHG